MGRDRAEERVALSEIRCEKGVVGSGGGGGGVGGGRWEVGRAVGTRHTVAWPLASVLLPRDEGVCVCVQV